MSLNSFRKTIFLALAVTLVLGACNFPARPAVSTPGGPGTAAPTSPPSGQPGTPQGETPSRGVVQPTLRPTSEAVAALSGVFPVFPGFYWNKDILVEEAGGGVRLLAGMPCSELVELLGSSEWRLTGQALPPFTSGMAPALARFDWGERAAFVRMLDLGGAFDLEGLQQGVMASPTPAVGSEDAGHQGCAATLEPLELQPFTIQGDLNEQGQAWAYPLPLGCMGMGEKMSVNMIYEGSGELRAKLTFSAPQALGQHALGGDNLSFELLRSRFTVMDYYTRAYASPDSGEELEGEWIELWPVSDENGTVIVTGLDPLRGEVELRDWESEDGRTFSFKAGFQCGVVEVVRK